NALEMYEQRRDARCFTHGVMIPYPFQKHFDEIGDALLTKECRDGLATASAATDAHDFDALVHQRFGAGVARHFLVPYNRKLWQTDLKELAVAWAGERLAAPPGRVQEPATPIG